METRIDAKRCVQTRLLAVLLLAGCALDGAEEREADREVELAHGALHETRTVHQWPRVTAGGSGCPAGSFRTTRSHHGMHVSISFDAYVTRVDETIPLTRRDCSVAIQVPEGDRRSYAVTAVTPSATASLVAGASALWSSVASIDGVHPPAGGDVVRSFRVLGPHDGAVTVPVSSHELTWSACGKRPDIHVTTITTVQNVAPFSVNQFDVQSLDIRLATRACP